MNEPRTIQQIPYVEKMISTAVLKSGARYQKPINKKHVRKLIENWDERLMDPLIVSYRDGEFHVVDGQHRSTAACEMNGGRNVVLPCKVYYGMTYEQEAELYYKLDQAKMRLNSAQSIRALLESDADGAVAEIDRLMNENGFTWAVGKSAPANYEIVATRATLNAYKLLGAAGFDRMLLLLSLAWDGAPKSLKANFITGFALFLKTYETKLTDKNLITRLGRIDPDDVVETAKTDYRTNRTALKCARAIMNKYNSQRGRKLPDLLTSI